MIKTISNSARVIQIINLGDNPSFDSCDVVVELRGGQRFGGTFFTQSYLSMLMEKNKRTGEFAGGQYLWAAGMIVVDRLDVETIGLIVDDLLGEGQLHVAFTGLAS